MVIVSRKNLYSRQQRIPNFSKKREKKISRDINKNISKIDNDIQGVIFKKFGEFRRHQNSKILVSSMIITRNT